MVCIYTQKLTRLLFVVKKFPYLPASLTYVNIKSVGCGGSGSSCGLFCHGGELAIVVVVIYFSPATIGAIRVPFGLGICVFLYLLLI